MSNSNSRPPYRGTEKGLVISIDFGTTYSGTSWALLDPNQVSQIRDVTGYEGQEDEANSTKIPSVLFYDRFGELQAAGAKTSDPEIEMQAQDEDWIRVEWFKLLLRPLGKDPELDDAPKTTLPPYKTAVDVIGDYIGHVASLARKHFLENMIGSAVIWNEVKNRIQYVLSHPNGWAMSQHDSLRKAAIIGGLVPDTAEGRARIHFVSEGEASFHWCLAEGLSRNDLKKGNRYIVVDAGGGTIDVSSFEVVSTGPLQLKEVAVSSSRLAGSVYVNQAFERYVEEKLVDGGSIYADTENIKQMVQEFEKRSKRKFRDVDQKTIVLFGSPREHDPKFGIRSGRLIVEGHSGRYPETS
ncbi:hypothetical protein FRC03_011055 [Tulasnella sp. 419]|nr:hypothetical protein FRC03_011055 [Tulasnella sp. 419]